MIELFLVGFGLYFGAGWGKDRKVKAGKAEVKQQFTVYSTTTKTTSKRKATGKSGKARKGK